MPAEKQCDELAVAVGAAPVGAGTDGAQGMVGVGFPEGQEDMVGSTGCEGGEIETSFPAEVVSKEDAYDDSAHIMPEGVGFGEDDVSEHMPEEVGFGDEDVSGEIGFDENGTERCDEDTNSEHNMPEEVGFGEEDVSGEIGFEENVDERSDEDINSEHNMPAEVVFSEEDVSGEIGFEGNGSERCDEDTDSAHNMPEEVGFGEEDVSGEIGFEENVDDGCVEDSGSARSMPVGVGFGEEDASAEVGFPEDTTAADTDNEHNVKVAFEFSEEDLYGEIGFCEDKSDKNTAHADVEHNASEKAGEDLPQEIGFQEDMGNRSDDVVDTERTVSDQVGLAEENLPEEIKSLKDEGDGGDNISEKVGFAENLPEEIGFQANAGDGSDDGIDIERTVSDQVGLAEENLPEEIKDVGDGGDNICETVGFAENLPDIGFQAEPGDGADEYASSERSHLTEGKSGEEDLPEDRSVVENSTEEDVCNKLEDCDKLEVTGAAKCGEDRLLFQADTQEEATVDADTVRQVIEEVSQEIRQESMNDCGDLEQDEVACDRSEGSEYVNLADVGFTTTGGILAEDIDVSDCDLGELQAASEQMVLGDVGFGEDTSMVEEIFGETFLEEVEDSRHTTPSDRFCHDVLLPERAGCEADGEIAPGASDEDQLSLTTVVIGGKPSGEPSGTTLNDASQEREDVDGERIATDIVALATMEVPPESDAASTERDAASVKADTVSVKGYTASVKADDSCSKEDAAITEGHAASAEVDRARHASASTENVEHLGNEEAMSPHGACTSLGSSAMTEADESTSVQISAYESTAGDDVGAKTTEQVPAESVLCDASGAVENTSGEYGVAKAIEGYVVDSELTTPPTACESCEAAEAQGACQTSVLNEGHGSTDTSSLGTATEACEALRPTRRASAPRGNVWSRARLTMDDLEQKMAKLLETAKIDFDMTPQEGDAASHEMETELDFASQQCVSQQTETEPALVIEAVEKETQTCVPLEASVENSEQDESLPIVENCDNEDSVVVDQDCDNDDSVPVDQDCDIVPKVEDGNDASVPKIEDCINASVPKIDEDGNDDSFPVEENSANDSLPKINEDWMQHLMGSEKGRAERDWMEREIRAHVWKAESCKTPGSADIESSVVGRLSSQIVDLMDTEIFALHESLVAANTARVALEEHVRLLLAERDARKGVTADSTECTRTDSQNDKRGDVTRKVDTIAPPSLLTKINYENARPSKIRSDFSRACRPQSPITPFAQTNEWCVKRKPEFAETRSEADTPTLAGTKLVLPQMWSQRTPNALRDAVEALPTPLGDKGKRGRRSVGTTGGVSPSTVESKRSPKADVLFDGLIADDSPKSNFDEESSSGFMLHTDAVNIATGRVFAPPCPEQGKLRLPSYIGASPSLKNHMDPCSVTSTEGSKLQLPSFVGYSPSVLSFPHDGSRSVSCTPQSKLRPPRFFV